jgi:hypothetical protein
MTLFVDRDKVSQWKWAMEIMKAGFPIRSGMTMEAMR